MCSSPDESPSHHHAACIRIASALPWPIWGRHGQTGSRSKVATWPHIPVALSHFPVTRGTRSAILLLPCLRAPIWA